MKKKVKYPTLEKLMNTPDDLLRDDDHLDRPALLNDEEAAQAGREMVAKYKNRKFIDGKWQLPKED
jgi:hypothetical protein